VLVQAEHVLPDLYGAIMIPPQVLQELQSQEGEEPVRRWAVAPPAWLVVREPVHLDTTLPIDVGEAAAISLAKEVNADRLLIDDRDGRRIAESLGLKVAGTLAVLRDAALQRRIDLGSVFERLRQTTFRASPGLYQEMLAEYDRRTGGKTT